MSTHLFVCDLKHLMKVTEHFRLLRYGHNGMERYQRTQSQSYAKITTCNHIAFKITRWISHFLQSSFSVNMHRSERIRSACFEMISIHLNLTLNNERFIAGYKNSSLFQICNSPPSSGRRSSRGTRTSNFLSSINNPSSMIRRWKLRSVLCRTNNTVSIKSVLYPPLPFASTWCLLITVMSGDDGTLLALYRTQFPMSKYRD